MKKHLSLILLWLIFISWFILRFYDLWFQSFWIDEWFSSYVSLEWFKNWIDLSLNNYFLHNLSQVLSFFVLWVSDFSARFPSVIFWSISIILIYIFSLNLFWDKRQALLSSFIYSFLSWEIIWARQARFYSLLEMLFILISLLLVIWFKTNRSIYLAFSIILIYIWINFHPFLYAFIWILWLVFLYKLLLNIKKINLEFIKNIDYKKYLSTYISIFIVWFSEIIKRIFLSSWTWVPSTWDLPDIMKEFYVNFYFSHLFQELWILVLFFLLWLILMAFKRKILWLIVLWINFLFIFYVVSQKGTLLHMRYALVLYNMIIIWWSYFVFYLYDIIKKDYFKYIYLVIIFFFIIFTWKYNFFPSSHYYIWHTSPQPNFKEAYKNIPNNSKVISWFPMLCEWYYKDRWECTNSLAVDFVWKTSNHEYILNKWKDDYTKLSYLESINELNQWEKYYFVFDDLTLRWALNRELIKQVFQSWKLIYESWEKYNNIKVFEYSIPQ